MSQPHPGSTQRTGPTMMPEKQRFEFDRETEARRRELRSASDAHRDFDGDLSRKILIAPEASPIPVAGIDEITARIPRENTQEEARAPIKMEDHNDTAQGMSSRGDAADEDVRGPPSPPRSDRTGEKRSPLLVDAILKATQKPGRAKVRGIPQPLRKTVADPVRASASSATSQSSSTPTI